MKLPLNRNLYNGDCTFLFYSDHYQADPAAPYTAQVFHDFIDLLADSGVDTYLNNANGQVPWYPSKVLPSMLEGYRRGDKEFFRGHYPPANDIDLPVEKLEAILEGHVAPTNRYLDLVEAGVDWVHEIVVACRRRGLSPWASVRMNDMHGASSWEGSYMNCHLQRDPKYRLKGQSLNPRDGLQYGLQVLNYEHREVRDYYFTIARELIDDYEHDGLELDWWRQAFCCEPPASQATIDMMTAWIAELRELTNARSRRSGKPCPLGLRLPCRLDVLRTYGLDVRPMAREGLIDFVSPSNGWQTTWDVPYDQLRAELGDDVMLYGVIEDAPNWMHALEPQSGKRSYRLLSTSPALMRGNAAGKMALGADAIETFNFFCSEETHHNQAPNQKAARYDALRGIENLDELRGVEKQYALQTSYGYWIFDYFEYAEQIPLLLEPQWKRPLRLAMCAEPVGAALELIVQIVVEAQDGLPDLGVGFNGSWPNFAGEATNELLLPTGLYTHHIPENTAFNYRFDIATIKEGWNEVMVYNGSPATEDRAVRQANTARIVSLEIAVRNRVAK